MERLEDAREALNRQHQLNSPSTLEAAEVQATNQPPSVNNSSVVSEDIDDEGSPTTIGWVTPGQVEMEMAVFTKLKKDRKTTNKDKIKSKYKLKLLNNYDMPIDDQNPWYFRFLHGAKTGALIGAAAGAIFSPAAPLVSIAVGTLIGAAGGGIVATAGSLLGGIFKKYAPRVYNFFYPPYVKVELKLTADEFAYINNSKLVYRDYSELNHEQVAAAENIRRQDFIAAKNKLNHDLNLRYLYPQKPGQFSRPSAFLKWDMNTMMGALAGVTIGAAIGTFIGGPFGAAIGGVVGGVVGVALATATPHIAQRTQPTVIVTPKYSNNEEAETEEVTLDRNLENTLLNAVNSSKPRIGSWYEESTNDVPWFIRLAVGAGAGAALGAAVGSVVPGIGTAIGTAAGALIFAGAAWASPHAFKGIRSIFSSIKNLFVDPNKPIEPENDERDDKNWPKSLKEDTYNFNWFIRLMPGVVAGAAVGAAVGTLFPGIGTAIGGLAGAVIGGGLAVASPFLFAVARNTVSLIHGVATDIFNYFSADNSENKVDKKALISQQNQAANAAPTEFDVPWTIRALAGATTGAAVGGTIGLVVGTVFPGIGNLVGLTAGAAIGTIAGTGAVIVWPPLRDAAVSLFTTIKESLFHSKADSGNLLIPSDAPQKAPTIPWFVKSMAGSMAGAIIGGAIGIVVGSAVPGIGTVIGGLAGAAIGGAAGAAIYIIGSMIIDAINAGSRKSVNPDSAKDSTLTHDDDTLLNSAKPQNRNHPGLDQKWSSGKTEAEKDASSRQALLGIQQREQEEMKRQMALLVGTTAAATPAAATTHGAAALANVFGNSN